MALSSNEIGANIGPEYRFAVVGESPGRHPRYRPHHALFPYPANTTGERLLNMMGCSKRAYIKGMTRLNLVDEWPGTEEGPSLPSLRSGIATKAHVLDGKSVLVVGKRTARAFGFVERSGGGDIEPFMWWTTCYSGASAIFSAAWVPHISGRNMWWNFQGNRDLGAAFLREFGGRVEQEWQSRERAFPESPSAGGGT